MNGKKAKAIRRVARLHSNKPNVLDPVRHEYVIGSPKYIEKLLKKLAKEVSHIDYGY
jgi:hypothetical protein